MAASCVDPSRSACAARVRGSLSTSCSRRTGRGCTRPPCAGWVEAADQMFRPPRPRSGDGRRGPTPTNAPGGWVSVRTGGETEIELLAARLHDEGLKVVTRPELDGLH